MNIQYKKELNIGEKIEKEEKNLTNEMRRILDDVIFEIDKFKYNINYNDEIFKLLKNDEKIVVFKVRKETFINQNRVSIDDIYRMNIFDKAYYNFKLLRLLYQNINNNEFYKTKKTAYLVLIAPSISYLYIKSFFYRSYFLPKIIVPLNVVLCLFIFRTIFKQELEEISFRKTELGIKINNLNKI